MPALGGGLRRSPPRSAAWRRRCMSGLRRLRARQWCARRCSHGYGDKAEGSGTRKPRASAGQRDPAQGERVFCPGGARPPVQAMIAFIDDHRQAHGVEPICRVLPIALSTYHAHVAKRDDPSRLRLARDRRDAALKEEVRRVFEANFGPTGSARSGGNCSARASMWPAARLPA